MTPSTPGHKECIHIWFDEFYTNPPQALMNYAAWRTGGPSFFSHQLVIIHLVYSQNFPKNYYFEMLIFWKILPRY